MTGALLATVDHDLALLCRPLDRCPGTHERSCRGDLGLGGIDSGFEGNGGGGTNGSGFGP